MKVKAIKLTLFSNCMKLPMEKFFSVTCFFLFIRISSVNVAHLLKKSLMESFFFVKFALNIAQLAKTTM